METLSAMYPNEKLKIENKQTSKGIKHYFFLRGLPKHPPSLDGDYDYSCNKITKSVVANEILYRKLVEFELAASEQYMKWKDLTELPVSPTNTATTASSTTATPSVASFDYSPKSSGMEEPPFAQHFLFSNLPDGDQESQTGFESDQVAASSEQIACYQTLPYETSNELLVFEDLDFSARDEEGLRPPRHAGGKPINVLDQSRATPEIRFKMMLVAIEYGWKEAQTKKQKDLISKKAIQEVAYDSGLKSPVGTTMMYKWMRELSDVANTLGPYGSDFLGSQSNFGKLQYHKQVELEAPGYLHKLFRKATKKAGVDESFIVLASTMNKLSLEDTSGPNLNISEYQLKNWFHECGGKCKKMVTKPLLTNERKEKRVTWCQERLKQLEDQVTNNQPVYFAFLDEKWFYPYSGRTWVKCMPQGEHEEEVIAIQTKKESSRRHVSKVMFLGVVGCPIPEKGFDGKIYLKRVAENSSFKKTTFKDNDFSDDVDVSTHVKHNWRSLCDDSMSAEEIISKVADMYDLSEEIRGRLVL